MEALSQFNEITSVVFDTFGSLYDNFFGLTLPDILANGSLPDWAVEGITSFLGWFGLADVKMYALLFGTAIIVVLIWKLVSWIIDILP